MQKKVIALAVAGLLSGAAYAQSNVTIYGAADASVEQVKATGAPDSARDIKSQMRVNSNSSILGFRGSEDLGGGVKAIFQFEQGVALDAGAHTLSGRDTFIGLEGGFGQVKAGLLTGPARDLGAKTDLVVGATGVGSMIAMLGKIQGAGTPTDVNPTGLGEGFSTWDNRRANAVQYASPKFSGFEVRGLYAPGENRAVGNNTKAAKTYELGGFYNNGGWFAGLTYGQVKAGTAAFLGAPANEGKLTNVRLAGSYTFQAGHKVSVLWEQNQQKPQAGDSRKQMTYGIGGKFKVSQPGAIIAQVYQTSKAKLGGNDVDQSQARFIAVGYEHSLSKRTTLKAYYSKITNKEASQVNYGIGKIGGTTPATLPGAGADPQAISVGIRHTF